MRILRQGGDSRRKNLLFHILHPAAPGKRRVPPVRRPGRLRRRPGAARDNRRREQGVREPAPLRPAADKPHTPVRAPRHRQDAHRQGAGHRDGVQAGPRHVRLDRLAVPGRDGLQPGEDIRVCGPRQVRRPVRRVRHCREKARRPPRARRDQAARQQLHADDGRLQGAEHYSGGDQPPAPARQGSLAQVRRGRILRQPPTRAGGPSCSQSTWAP